MTKLTIKEKINHLLEETRIVLPGTQALLGFQLVAVFSDGFSKIPNDLQNLHLISLILIALTTIILMSVSAYDRIVNQDYDTEDFHTFASRMVLIALFLLGLGLTGDLYLVSMNITQSSTISTLISGAVLVFAYSLWFGFTSFKRIKND